MKILVANLGSTSFKYRLFQMDGDTPCLLTKGGYERVEDFAEVIGEALQSLIQEGHLSSLEDLDGVGFKTVLGKDLSGCVPADDKALKALEDFAYIAPAHNPAYANGIRQFAKRTSAPLVALFETSFYQWMPETSKRYAIPESWYAAGIRRYGFHGASHKFIAERSAHLLERPDVEKRIQRLYVDGPGEAPETPLRVISCHLGGSSSVTAIENGIAVATTMGLSPQSGLPQNNRVGDLDSMAIPLAMNLFGLSVEEAVATLSKEGGLLGLSGVSNDIRDIDKAAKDGNKQAALALEFLAVTIRHYIGAFTFQMGGVDAIVFTAGIGENQISLRTRVCENLGAFGIVLDSEKNAEKSDRERDIAQADSPCRIFIIPTNEEAVVATETYRLLSSSN